MRVVYYEFLSHYMRFTFLQHVLHVVALVPGVRAFVRADDELHVVVLQEIVGDVWAEDQPDGALLVNLQCTTSVLAFNSASLQHSNQTSMVFAQAEAANSHYAHH